MSARMMRQKAAAMLGIDQADLETDELKELLDAVVMEHFQKEQRDEEEEVSEEQEEPESENLRSRQYNSTIESETEEPASEVKEIVDELDENGEVADGVEAEHEKTRPKNQRTKKQVDVKAEEKPKRKRFKKSDAEETPFKGRPKANKGGKNEDMLIKLKSYVFKCGVRKTWKKELEGLNEKQSLDKVRRILEELGMEGRPSLEKCKQIKAKREYEEEMKSIDTSLIVESRLRSSRSGDTQEQPSESTTAKSARLNLSLYGDVESD